MPNDNSTGETSAFGKKTHSDFSKTLLRLKRKLLSRVWLVRTLILLPIVIVVILLFSLFVKSVHGQGLSHFGKVVWSFILAPTDGIKLTDNRVNILVMGIGGRDHAGGDLTDTMIMVSVPMDRSPLIAVSIPRDIWIPEIRAKINSAYYWGNQKRDGGGLALSKSLIEKVTGVPIHYGIVLDFSAFEKIVEDLGGVDVNVENSFTDTHYPIAGRENDLCDGDPEYLCRYETITFEKGQTHMNGVLALKFVRSRYSESAEGTDTAREARQQKIIDAIKTKLLSPKVLLNIPKDIKIWNDLNGSLERDISDEGAGVIAKKILQSKGSPKKYLIPEFLLFNPPITPAYDKQYVFVPIAGNGNWGEINSWVKNIIR